MHSYLQPQPNNIRFLSILCLISAVYAVSCKFYVTAFLLLCQCILSFSYWNNPKKGIIRNMDMFMTVFNFIYFVYHYPPSIILILPICILSYYEEQSNNDQLLSADIWMILHICAFCNVSFIIWKHSNGPSLKLL